jgi:transcriptional regulator of acetoin/glycerol metabolism
VGTCLRIGKPVTIIGSHHYGIDTQSLTCLTAPVLGRLGSVESVLNVTTPRAGDERTNRVVENIVARAARRIENRYFSRLHQNATILRLSGDREYVDLAEEARIAINADGVIFAGTSYVATLMGRSAVEDIVGQSAEELFELGVALSEIRPEKPFQVHLGEKPLYASVTDQTFRTVRRGAPATPSLTVPAQPITIYEPGKTGDLPGDELRLDPMTAMALDRACRLLEAGLPIIVKGESGTGKTAFARLAASRTFGDQHATFIVDCCATSGIAIASAAAQVVGANRSNVLILDRLDELDPAGQTALLSILEGNIRPLAARCILIVVATADLDDLARDGVLRPDLLHRVKGGSIELPPLRNRPDLDETIEDLLRLELASLGKFGLKLDEEARLVLANYHWPGNLRELRYALRHAAALADGGNIQLHHLPSNIVFEIARKDLTARSQAEASRIEAVLRFNGGNVSRTAKHLGVSRATLYRKIQIQKTRQES